jgi:putative transposase
MGKRVSWNIPGDAHELTFSCYRRQMLMDDDALKERFVQHLFSVKQDLGLELLAFVVMPNHCHILLWSEALEVSQVLSKMKGPFAFQVLREWKEVADPRLELCRVKERDFRFWQHGGGYDRNFNQSQSVRNSINYIHQNPVKSGFVESASDWRWSSARAYEGEQWEEMVDLWIGD